MKKITIYAMFLIQLIHIQELSASSFLARLIWRQKESTSSNVTNNTTSEIITPKAWHDSMISDIYRGKSQPTENEIISFKNKIEEAKRLGFFFDDVNQKIRPQDAGISLLHASVMCKKVAYAAALLEAGTDPNIQYKNVGRAPLHFAAQDSDNQSANLLIAHGANVNIHDANGLTPLFFAESKDNDTNLQEQEAVIQTLKNAGATPVAYTTIQIYNPFVTEHS